MWKWSYTINLDAVQDYNKKNVHIQIIEIFDTMLFLFFLSLKIAWN